MQRAVCIEIEAEKLLKLDKHLNWLQWEQLSNECKEAFIRDARKNAGISAPSLQRAIPKGI